MHTRRIEAQGFRGKLLDLERREGTSTRPTLSCVSHCNHATGGATALRASWLRLDLIPEGLPCRRVGGEELVQPPVALGIDRLSDLLKSVRFTLARTLGRSSVGW